MTHRTTIHLSDIADEIERELIDEAEALVPGDEPDPIIVEQDTHAIVDGFHRTAGYLRWAREQGLAPADVEIDVVVCDDDELIVLAAEPGAEQAAAIAAIYALADGEDPRAVTVLGLGADWTVEDAAEWERYGVVEVEVGGETYEVGCAIGVPEHLRGTARAAGGDTVTPYLSAWYVSPSDWQLAPCAGGDGLPAFLSRPVLAAIEDAARRLWDEHAEGRHATRAALVAAIEGARLGSVTDYDPDTGCGMLSVGAVEAEPGSEEYEAEGAEQLAKINAALRPLGLVAAWDGTGSTGRDGDASENVTVRPLEV